MGIESSALNISASLAIAVARPIRMNIRGASCSRRFWQRCRNMELGAFGAVESDLAAECFHALAHVAQAISCSPIHYCLGIKTTPVILNRELKNRIFDAKLDAHLGCAGVLKDIVKGLLDHQEKLMPEFSGQRVVRQLNRD